MNDFERDWKAKQEAKSERLDSMSKKSTGNKLISGLAKEKKNELDPGVEQTCDIMRMLVGEACEEYREGAKLEDVVKDLCEALKVVNEVPPTKAKKLKVTLSSEVAKDCEMC